MPSSVSDESRADPRPPAPVRGSASAARQRRTRWQLVAIFAISAAPVVLGTLTFWYWRDAGQTNYGQLLAPKQVELTGIDLSGRAMSLSESKGKWRYVILDSAGCDENCRRKLLYTRQIRIATGRDQERVERVWALEGGGVPNQEIAGLIDDARLIRLNRDDEADAFGAVSEHRDFIYLVDPYGNLMMRYSSDPDPRRMIKDLQRLLKYTKTL